MHDKMLRKLRFYCLKKLSKPEIYVGIIQDRHKEFKTRVETVIVKIKDFTVSRF